MSEKTPPDSSKPPNDDALFKVPFLPNALKKRTASQGPENAEEQKTNPKDNMHKKFKPPTLAFSKMRIIDDIRNYQIKAGDEPAAQDDSQPGPSNRMYIQNPPMPRKVPKKQKPKKPKKPVVESEEEDVFSDGECDEELAAVVARLLEKKYKENKLEGEVKPCPIVAKQVQDMIEAASKPHQLSISAILAPTPPKPIVPINPPPLNPLPLERSAMDLELFFHNGTLLPITDPLPCTYTYKTPRIFKEPPPVDYSWVPPPGDPPIPIPKQAWVFHEQKKAEYLRALEESIKNMKMNDKTTES